MDTRHPPRACAGLRAAGRCPTRRTPWSRVESSGNPHAIGVVGGALERQPRHRAEALATARALQAAGWNFSLGLAQINVRNLARLGLTLDTAFDPCTNLARCRPCWPSASSARRAVSARRRSRRLRQALSCYYSGNFSPAFAHGYVRTVALAAARRHR